MIQLSERTRRGLTQAIAIPSAIGMLMLVIVALHQILATVI